MQPVHASRQKFSESAVHKHTLLVLQTLVYLVLLLLVREPWNDTSWIESAGNTCIAACIINLTIPYISRYRPAQDFIKY